MKASLRVAASMVLATLMLCAAAGSPTTNAEGEQGEPQIVLSYQGEPGLGVPLVYTVTVSALSPGTAEVWVTLPAAVTLISSELPWIGQMAADETRVWEFVAVAEGAITEPEVGGSINAWVHFESDDERVFHVTDQLRVYFSSGDSEIRHGIELDPQAESEAWLTDNPSVPIPLTPSTTGPADLQEPFDLALTLSEVPVGGSTLTVTLALTSNIGIDLPYQGHLEAPAGWTIEIGEPDWSDAVPALSRSDRTFVVSAPPEASGYWRLTANIDFPAADYESYVWWQSGEIHEDESYLYPQAGYRITEDQDPPGNTLSASAPGMSAYSSDVVSEPAILQQMCLPKYISFRGQATSRFVPDHPRSLRADLIEIGQMRGGRQNGETIRRTTLTAGNGGFQFDRVPAVKRNGQKYMYMIRISSTDSANRDVYEPPFSILWWNGRVVYRADSDLYTATEVDTNCSTYINQYINVDIKIKHDAEAHWMASLISHDAYQRLQEETDHDPRSNADYREYGRFRSGGSSYRGPQRTLYISPGEPKQTVWHEYGHAVLFQVYDPSSHADVPGYPNNDGHFPGNPSSFGSAFHEGWAEFFSMWVPRLGNVDLGGGYLIEFENVGASGFGGYDERNFAGALLDIWDSSADGVDTVALTLGPSGGNRTWRLLHSRPFSAGEFKRHWCELPGAEEPVVHQIFDSFGIGGCRDDANGGDSPGNTEWLVELFGNYYSSYNQLPDEAYGYPPDVTTIVPAAGPGQWNWGTASPMTMFGGLAGAGDYDIHVDYWASRFSTVLEGLAPNHDYTFTIEHDNGVRFIAGAVGNPTQRAVCWNDGCSGVIVSTVTSDNDGRIEVKIEHFDYEDAAKLIVTW